MHEWHVELTAECAGQVVHLHSTWTATSEEHAVRRAFRHYEDEQGFNVLACVDARRSLQAPSADLEKSR
jgi:hypothetical protein